jgi:hypothetical protein
MKKILFTAIAIFSTAFISMAQSADKEDIFYFNYVEGKLDDSEIDETYLSSHSFGDVIAKKLELMKQAYTWREEGTPTNPVERTVVEKGAIYYAIKNKLNSHYRKAVKKGGMDEEAAKAEFASAIDVALFIRYQQTDEFEAKLRDLKDAEDIAMLFNKKVKIQY